MGKGGRRYPIEHAEGRELDFALIATKDISNMTIAPITIRLRCSDKSMFILRLVFEAGVMVLGGGVVSGFRLILSVLPSHSGNLEQIRNRRRISKPSFDSAKSIFEPHFGQFMVPL
jgi:hypothetical protein